MRETTYGDPLLGQKLTMGPLINRKGLDKVDALVRAAVRDGAEVVTGGKIADRDNGFHYEPSVLVNCRSDMDLMRREIFGPVLPIQTIGDLDEGIALANDSEYGLTSSLFTNDLNAMLKATRELKFGETFVNRNNFEAIQGFHAGRRKSGIGGADGKHGLYEYMETHMVYIEGQ
jgi:lactaldehyde dehydrogenase / glycolaldehyde dehydrogenase